MERCGSLNSNDRQPLAPEYNEGRMSQSPRDRDVNASFPHFSEPSGSRGGGRSHVSRPNQIHPRQQSQNVQSQHTELQFQESAFPPSPLLSADYSSIESFNGRVLQGPITAFPASPEFRPDDDLVTYNGDRAERDGREDMNQRATNFPALTEFRRDDDLVTYNGNMCGRNG